MLFSSYFIELAIFLHLTSPLISTSLLLSENHWVVPIQRAYQIHCQQWDLLFLFAIIMIANNFATCCCSHHLVSNIVMHYDITMLFKTIQGRRKKHG